MSIDRSALAGLCSRFRARVALLTIIAGICVVVAAACRQEAPPRQTALRLSLAPGYSFGLSLAPDGRRVAFPRITVEGTQLSIHDLTADTIVTLEGTTEAALPFWSPDGGAIAYFAEGKLRVYTFVDRSVRDLADAATPRGGVWHPGGDILFAPDDRGLQWHRASGAIEPFTTPGDGESDHRLPRVTADGRHVVFFVRASERARQGIWMAAIDDPSSRRRLINSDAEGIPIDQALVYSSGGALVAQRINFDRRVLQARPVLLGSTVGHSAEHQLFATAAADVLLFGAPPATLRELRWVDRGGAALGVVGEPMDASDVRIAPRGATVAVTRVDPQLNTLDIWAYDDQRPLPRRLSPNIDVDDAPAWSRDATRLAWVSGRRMVTIRDARAAQPDISLRKFDHPVRVTDWAADDEWLVLTETRRETRADILLMRPDGEGDVRSYAASAFNETQGAVSPDGRWMAYASDESGRDEIYVDAFPTPGQRARVTVGGGAEPRWNRDGRALFFRRGAAVHMVRLGVAAARVEALSSEQLFESGGDIRSFDVAPDGTRFLINIPAAQTETKPMTVLVHVSSLLP